MRYRILEKKGKYYKPTDDCLSIYIVQQFVYHSGNTRRGLCIEHGNYYEKCPDWIDLATFDSEWAARKFKRNLNLDEGIVLE